MKNVLTPLLLLIAIFVSAQNGPNNPDYKKAVDIALGELQKGQCKPCLEAYERAFAISKHSALSHLRAARCAQMCNDASKAQAFADKAVEISWNMAANGLQNINDYPELAALKDSDLGKKTLKKTATRAKASGFNAELAKELERQ